MNRRSLSTVSCHTLTLSLSYYPDVRSVNSKRKINAHQTIIGPFIKVAEVGGSGL